MSTLVYEYSGDGHRPEVSPDGQKVAWGDENLKVVHVPNPAAIWPVGPGRDLRFLTNDLITWVRVLGSTAAQRYQADLRNFSVGLPTLDPAELVAGNDFYASNGTWISVLERLRRLTYRSPSTQFEKLGVRAGRLKGDWLATIETKGSGEVVVLYHRGLTFREFPLHRDFHRFNVSEKGLITFGYYGQTWLLTHDGRVHDITICPNKQESVARLVHLPNGETWAWTSTVFLDVPMVIGRPLIITEIEVKSSDQCVVLRDFAAEGVDAGWWTERQAFTVAGSANLGNTTPLQVHVVPLTHSREKLEDKQPILDTSGELVNLWDFIVPDRKYWPRTSKRGHDMDVSWDGENFYTLPFGEFRHWVRFRIKDGVMTLIEDHSKDGQNTGDWSATKGTWLKQHMAPRNFGGEVLESPDNWLVRYAADSCDIVDAHPLAFKTYLHQHWRQFYCGPDLGWQEVIVTAADLGTLVEYTYWAKGGRSLFRFQAVHGETGKLHFENWFELFGGPHLTPTPGCWKPEHLAINSWPVGEDDVNKPGIDIIDYEKIIEPGRDLLIVHWKDRNNPGHERKVKIVRGRLLVEDTVDGWKTKSDYTGNSRAVTIKG
jgi:hypothetical protein